MVLDCVRYLATNICLICVVARRGYGNGSVGVVIVGDVGSVVLSCFGDDDEKYVFVLAV